MSAMNEALSYDQVALTPNFGIVSTRKDCDVSVDFLGNKFDLPIIPANMKCSIDWSKAKWCSDNNIFYVLHRFYDYHDIKSWSYNNVMLKSISVGVQGKDCEILKDLSKSSKIDYITIDVAHGYSKDVRDLLTYIKGLNWINGAPKIIVGNIATPDAAASFTKWGADALKVGIGQGHVCTTRLETGVGMPMFTCIQECVKATHLPIIADGGINHLGDAAKAIAAGATMVMVGSMFARCIDSPAETIIPSTGSVTYKRWYGSASEENKGKDQYVEGKCVFEPTNGLTYAELLRKWKEALQSAVSYAGGDNLQALQNCKFKIVRN
jgi:GMP reductase